MPPRFTAMTAALMLMPGLTISSAHAFTEDQAAAGKLAYEANCAMCHGTRAEGGEAPALSGVDVMGNFATAAGLYDFFAHTMPPQAPGLLGEETYLAILAQILVLNGAAPDGQPLVAEPAALAAVSLDGLGHAVAAGSNLPAPDAPGMGTNVPQAYTWGKPLPVASGGETQVAAESGADSAEDVPQAFTWGQKLPTTGPAAAQSDPAAEPTSAAAEPTADPAEPSATAAEPSTTPADPTPTPAEPAATPADSAAPTPAQP